MADVVAQPRTWKGLLFLVLLVFAVVFFFAATSIIIWAIVVAVVGAFLFVVRLIIRGLVTRGDRRFGGGA